MMERVHSETSELLGLPEGYSDLDWSRALAKGLPTEAFDRLFKAISPEDKAVWYAVLPRSTLVRRRKEKRLSPEESERIQRIAEVWALALDVFRDETKARR